MIRVGKIETKDPEENWKSGKETDQIRSNQGKKREEDRKGKGKVDE